MRRGTSLEQDFGEATDDEVFAASRPEGWQRALRTIGCPIMLAGSAAAAWAVVGAVGAVTWPWLGWVAGGVAFLVALPSLLGLVAAFAGLGKNRARRELRQRVGQGSFEEAVRRTAADLSGLAEGEAGEVLLLRGRRVDGGLHLHLRLDAREHEDGAVARLEAVRGPGLNVYDIKLTGLEGWQKLAMDPGGEWLDRLRALPRDGLGSEVPRARYRFEGALIDVGQGQQVLRFATAFDELDSGDPLHAALADLLAVPGWDLAMDYLPDV